MKNKEEEKKKFNDLFFCGDIHGNIRKLVWTIIYRYGLKDCSVIVVGDFGAGFEKKEYLNQMYKKVESRLESNNVTIYAIRGNHDDPNYFSGEDEYQYPRLKLLPDFKVVEICGKKILPIGGGVSVDRELRIKQGLGYWPNERIVKKPVEELPNKVDVIVSHMAPLSFLPVETRMINESKDIWEDNLEDRKYLDEVLEQVITDDWYYGHYHKSISGNYGNVSYRGLDIDELFIK